MFKKNIEYLNVVQRWLYFKTPPEQQKIQKNVRGKNYRKLNFV